MLKDTISKVEGRVGLWRVRELRGRKQGQVLHRWVEPITFKPNQIQYDWGYIAAQAIGRGQSAYKIAAMYIEYENLAPSSSSASSFGGETPVSIPSFGRDEGTEYYDDLQSSGTRDFLRVPLLQDPMIGVATGYESYFTAGVDGNKLTFFAQSQGVEGVHGKTFSDSVNSKIFGAALVATPVFADRTQDVVFARSYFPEAEQTLKEASSQVGISWEVSFK